MSAEESPLAFSSSDPDLSEGFAWAKAQALAYVFRGDPVGDWYEAALPGREAFCMRDVSHQSAGARALGLQEVTRNMLHAFARNTGEARDWCTFWEIDRRGLPCAVDYRDDRQFWYNLPASFDVLQTIVQEYLWTGDRFYTQDPAVRAFAQITVTRYIEAWDRDGDGIPEHHPQDGTRGLGSYDEGKQGMSCLVGGDLVALQYAAFLAYAALREMDGARTEAQAYRVRAQALKDRYNRQWWDEEQGVPRSLMTAHGSFSSEYVIESQVFPLLCRIVADGERTKRTLDGTVRAQRPGVEARSYLPETWYRYGRVEEAASELRALVSPGLPRREYPEVSFAAIGSIALGLMGIDADARHNLVSTMPRLSRGEEWASMEHVPVLGSSIAVRHERNACSTVTNLAGRAFQWKACFPGRHGQLVVDGRKVAATPDQGVNGQLLSWVCVPVEPGASSTVCPA